MGTFHRFGHVGILFPLLWLLGSCVVGSSASVVSIIRNDDTLSFEAVDANFAPAVIASGVYGDLYLAKPLNACSELKNEVNRLSNTSSPFVLIIRGDCSFEEKVRRAQNASFKAVIVYNNEENGPSVEMSGNTEGIQIPAVFVSRIAGDVLTSIAGSKDVELWIIPDYDDSTWCIMVVSFFSLLVMSATLAICFFVRRHRIRLERTRPNSRVREFHGMSSRLVKAMPSLIFTSVLEDNYTSVTCAICLEDYNVGEKLRILPCRHKFHALCVDMWLTTWRTFCPVCKRDARTSNGEPPASESTPLLSPTPSASSIASLYARSSVPSSSAMRISQSPTPSWVLTPSIQNSQMMSHQSLRPCCYSPAMSVSRSTNDLRNASSQRSHLASPHSLGHASSSRSPRNSRFMSAYAPIPSYGSSSHLGSSQQNQNPLHCSESESASSFSPFASSHSLPDC